MKIKRSDKDKSAVSDLGQSVQDAEQVNVTEDKVLDDALGLQLISIRLQKKLIEDLKEMAQDEGITYQPLIRQILTRHVKESKASKARLATAR